MTEPTTSSAPAGQTSGRYRYYVLGMLGLTYAFSFMDRNIVSILMGDLKAEFDLNDTQLGLLGGLAFALFYSVLAIPIARFADRSHRINIISIAVALWSLVTAACAYTTNFWQLLMCRIGVGVGEAGGLSPSHSVISDYFDAKERSLAISLFSLGAAVGAFMGVAMGGWVAENYGWRTAFLVAGLPGLALALALKFTVREPIRGATDRKAQGDDTGLSFLQTGKVLIGNVVYRNVVIAHVLAVFAGYSVATWLPQVLLRNYELTQTTVGILSGIIFLTGATLGMICGGWLATKFAKERSARWEALIPTIGLSVAVPVYLFSLAATNLYITVIGFIVAGFFFNWQHGPGLAVVQNAVKPEQRATAASFNFFLSNLLGLGLGPLFVGIMSDAMSDSLGTMSLNAALGASIMIGIPAAIMFYRTSRLLK